MAKVKYASAVLAKPEVSGRYWNQIKTASKQLDPAEDIIKRASEFMKKPFDPSDYLISHCTIISSVNTVEPDLTKMSSTDDWGFKSNLKYPNFRITPETLKYINDNNDAWEREVLLKSYKSFIGASNYLNHIQIEALSKGRVLDAVAREVGDSIFVDILVATEKIHTELVKDIVRGKMSTLSMGCQISGSSCSKCGHWASDESESCVHVRHERGNTFIDVKSGYQGKVAELCGHKSLEDGGVQFVDASWVENPAFHGAVLRNILEPTAETAAKAAMILNSIPPQWRDGEKKVASKLLWAGKEEDAPTRPEDAPEDTAEDPVEEVPVEVPAEAPAAPVEDPKKKVIDDVYNDLMEQVGDKLKDIVKEELKGKSQILPAALTDDTLLKVACKVLASTSTSGISFIDAVARYATKLGSSIPIDIYRTAITAGKFSNYSSVKEYAGNCMRIAQRDLVKSELEFLVRLARSLDVVSSAE